MPAVAYEGRIPASTDHEIVTEVAGSRLRALNDELLTFPEGFTVQPKLAEQLAFASLIVEGIPVRLTGQDTERGTFSHRHLVLHDAENGEVSTPLQSLRDSAASFEVHNSPVSETACIGFEYGYA